ncbi:MAG: O-antigen ligase family protein, partial [Planctomycetota bacterium]
MNGVANDPKPAAPSRRRGFRVPTIWALAIVVSTAFFWMEHFPAASTKDDYAPSQESMEDANTTADPGRRLALLALLGLTGFGLWKGTPLSLRSAGLAGWTPMVWLTWMVLSTLWSYDRGTTIRRLVVLALFHGAALAICRLLKSREVVKFAAHCVGLQLAVGIAAEFFYGTFRPWGGEYRFAGTVHPNIQALQLSSACVSAAALAAFAGGWRERSRWAALAIVVGLFLTLTKSRTSTGGAALAIAGVLLLAVPPVWKRNLFIPAVLVVCLAAMAALFSGFDPSDELHDAALMGRNEQQTTLSGRVPIWEALDPYVAQRWWKGWGYSAFWSKDHIDRLTSEVDFKFSGAHSGYYE